MFRDLVPQKIIDAMLRVAGPSIINMAITPHPTGPGYCVYDAQGNVAVFDYDPAADQATLRYSTIPSVRAKAADDTGDNAADPQRDHAPAPASAGFDEVFRSSSHRGGSWADIRSPRCGFLPGFLYFIGFLSFFVGLVSFAMAPAFAFYAFLLSAIGSAFLFWLGAVLNALRNIETHFYFLNHPDRDSFLHQKKPGE